MITVGNFPDLASAQLAQAMLKAEGIASSIPDEHLAGLDWRLTGGLGGVRLQVAPDDAAAAAAMLAEGASFDPAELDRLAGAEDLDSDSDLCPACGSRSIGTEPSQRRAKALTMLVAPVTLILAPFLAGARKRLLCGSCGHTWHPTA